MSGSWSVLRLHRHEYLRCSITILVFIWLKGLHPTHQIAVPDNWFVQICTTLEQGRWHSSWFININSVWVGQRKRIMRKKRIPEADQRFREERYESNKRWRKKSDRKKTIKFLLSAHFTLFNKLISFVVLCWKRNYDGNQSLLWFCVLLTGRRVVYKVHFRDTCYRQQSPSLQECSGNDFTAC